MTIRQLASQKYLALSEEDCDLNQAQYDPSLSQAMFDKETSTFLASYDYLQNRSLVELLRKLIPAHGYEINLENFLACLETLWFGNFVALRKQKSSSSPATAKAFFPSLSIQLPIKGKTGYLLKLFYQEMKSAGLQTDEKSGKGIKEDKDELLREQKKQIEALKNQIDGLHKLLNQKQGVAGLASSDPTLMPSGVRIAKVHRIEFTQRQLIAKAGRQLFKVPFAFLRGMPEEEDHCILFSHILAPLVEAVFPDRPLAPLSSYIGKVCSFHQGNIVKVKCPNLGYWQFKPLNDWEFMDYKRLKLDAAVVLSFWQGNLIRFQPVCHSFKHESSYQVQEDIAKSQLSPSSDFAAKDQDRPAKSIKEII